MRAKPMMVKGCNIKLDIELKVSQSESKLSEQGTWKKVQVDVYEMVC